MLQLTRRPSLSACSGLRSRSPELSPWESLCLIWRVIPGSSVCPGVLCDLYCAWSNLANEWQRIEEVALYAKWLDPGYHSPDQTTTPMATAPETST